MTFHRRTPMIQTNQVHHCRKCGASKVLLPGQCHSEERKSEVLQAYLEQPSPQGLNLTFGIPRNTIIVWPKNS